MTTTTFPFVREEEYHQRHAWGLSTQIDMYGCDPDLIRSRDAIEQFTHRLCDMLKVERFGPTQIVRFGNHPEVYGYSMVQLIQTSLVSAHFAEDTNAVYLDVFSCRYYDATEAVDYAREFFKASDVRVNSSLRL
jgi:S-adenosylmethionine decarboxylase